MGHEDGSSGILPEAQGDLLRLSEFYANIALTDVFQNGAAISRQGALVYPFLDSSGLSPQNTELFRSGRITHVRPDEIFVDVKSPTSPPDIFLIPPHSLEKIAFQKHFRRSRQLHNSLMLFHGLDDNDKPITDWLSNNSALMDGLKNIAVANIKRNGINPETDLNMAPKTIVKNALSDMAIRFGVGNLAEVVQKTIEQNQRENEETVAEVEKFLNGNHDK